MISKHYGPEAEGNWIANEKAILATGPKGYLEMTVEGDTRCTLDKQIRRWAAVAALESVDIDAKGGKSDFIEDCIYGRTEQKPAKKKGGKKAKEDQEDDSLKPYYDNRRSLDEIALRLGPDLKLFIPLILRFPDLHPEHPHRALTTRDSRITFFSNLRNVINRFRGFVRDLRESEAGNINYLHQIGTARRKGKGLRGKRTTIRVPNLSDFHGRNNAAASAAVEAAWNAELNDWLTNTGTDTKDRKAIGQHKLGRLRALRSDEWNLASPETQAETLKQRDEFVKGATEAQRL